MLAIVLLLDKLLGLLYCRVSKKGPNSIFEILEIFVPKYSSHCPLHDDIDISSLFYTQF